MKLFLIKSIPNLDIKPFITFYLLNPLQYNPKTIVRRYISYLTTILVWWHLYCRIQLIARNSKQVQFHLVNDYFIIQLKMEKVWSYFIRIFTATINCKQENRIFFCSLCYSLEENVREPIWKRAPLRKLCDKTKTLNFQLAIIKMRSFTYCSVMYKVAVPKSTSLFTINCTEGNCIKIPSTGTENVGDTTTILAN